MQDWVKLHTDMLDNPDVALMDPLEYQFFTFLMLLCRREGFDDGCLVGWDFWRLSYRFRMNIEDVTRCVTRLSREDVTWVFVTENGTICVKNYAERQCHKNVTERVKARERKRAQRIREKQGSLDSSENVTPLSRASHAPVTPLSRDRIEEKRIEETREEKLTTSGAGAPVMKETAPPKSDNTNPKPVNGRPPSDLVILEESFASISGIARPKHTTEKQKRECSERWWTPLGVIHELTGHNLEKSKTLIRDAIGKLRASNMTFDAPASIVKTARSINANGASYAAGSGISKDKIKNRPEPVDPSRPKIKAFGT